MFWRFGTLLVTLVVLQVLALPLQEARLGITVVSLLFLGVIVTGVVAASRARWTFFVALLLALPAFSTELFILVGGNRGLAVLRDLSYLSLLSFGIVVLLWWGVLKQERVTVDVLIGGICVYLLIGMWFYFAYSVVELLRPGSFLLDENRLLDSGGLGRFLDLVYFSNVTLSTLGFGDVRPVTPAARTLSMTEALVGQIYLATLVAVLVGMHLTHRQQAAPTPPRAP